MVYSSKDAPGLITDVMVFKTEYIKANPDVIKALIQGYLDGLDYMKKNPDKAAEIIGKFMGVTGAEVKEQLSGVYNPTLRRNGQGVREEQGHAVFVRQRRDHLAGAEGQRTDHDHPEDRGYLRRLVRQGDAEEVRNPRRNRDHAARLDHGRGDFSQPAGRLA